MTEESDAGEHGHRGGDESWEGEECVFEGEGTDLWDGGMGMSKEKAKVKKADLLRISARKVNGDRAAY